MRLSRLMVMLIRRHLAFLPRSRKPHLSSRKGAALYLTLWHPCILLLLAMASASYAATQLAPGLSQNRETFVLSGTVMNSVTGEPISRALVRASGQASRSAFSDSEGRFQFEGLPAGQIMLTAQKPGYFSEQEANGHGQHAIQVGPSTGAQTVKLQPLSAIFGRVTDASGQPIERIPVRLICRSLRDGRKIWEPRGMSETDEDGHFRFPNLMPATYYLSAGPAQSEGQILPAGQKPTTGFPFVYYPGVPDLASAAPIQLTAGQPIEADFSVTAVPVYHVTGSITGQAPDHGAGLLTFTSSGDDLMLPASVNSELGTFSLDSVPAGSYILKAMSHAEGQPLHAEQRITVVANLDNVHLALTPAISIPVVVHTQARASSAAGTSIISRSSGSSSGIENRPPVSVSLLPTQPNATQSFSSFQPSSAGNSVMVLQNVDPGTYTVDLRPQPPWYVQSASYGQTNALSDDITVAAGQAYPLEIALRDDSASLTVTVKGLENTTQPTTSVVILPQPASKLVPRVSHGITNTYTETGLAPGDYLVFAFDRIDGLEYTNPEALGPYASQAAQVTLGANQQAQVSLDLIPVGKGE